MTIQNWSDQIIMVEVTDDPDFTDELNTLSERLEKGEKKDVVLNLSRVKFLNSSNISRLLKLRKIILENQSRLCLCEVPIQVWGVFLLTGLDSIFDVAEETSAALASMQLNSK